MVFCYKLITDSPRRCLSSKKASALDRFSNMPSSMSQLMSSLDYEAEEALDEIPEHDWKLLAALARKKNQDDEREKLAEQFKKMWEKEKEERNMVAAEAADQYKRYINRKRQDEQSWLEYKRLQKSVEQRLKTGQLMDAIKHKERRSAELLAWRDDKKISDQVDKALEEEARAHLAADRRTRLDFAEKCRKMCELDDAQRREDDARRRRGAYLRDTARRVAISNALSTWETALLRQEVTAMETARRAQFAAHAALTDVRSARLATARASRQRRAKRVAAFTAQLRDIVRGGTS